MESNMAKDSKNEASIPNPALQPLSVLVGEWKTVGTHPYLPGKLLHGHSSFQWLEGGAFLIWHSEIEDEHFPMGVAIFGSDDATGEFFMLYFDERKVTRKHDVSVQDNVVKWWRNAPGPVIARSIADWSAMPRGIRPRPFAAPLALSRSLPREHALSCPSGGVVF